MTSSNKTAEESSPTKWFTYIVECSDSTYYTGVTTNLKRRINEHNNSVKGAKYTRYRQPVTLVYYEETESRQLACRREYAIKQMRVAQKRALINLSAVALVSSEPCSNLL
ncbi:MAG: hypothetical protein COA36_12150 [Desulfotalea sp.]|nr:MAG: hypothetical protein COA36_12150 [Desulfotalea sp.]